MEWKRLHEGKIKEPILDYLEKLIVEGLNAGKTLRVCIGTDSQKHGKGYKYASVITLISEGCGGIIIFSTEFITGTIKINERMLKEVEKSIAIAYEICPLLDLYNIKMEIHADINPDPSYASNKALKAAIGYIQGMGYGFKIKPDSFASSSVADKLC